jgi:hypothetical protein
MSEDVVRLLGTAGFCDCPVTVTTGDARVALLSDEVGTGSMGGRD